MNFVLFCVVLAFVLAVASIYYQSVVRPFVQDYVKFEIFRTRDELRQMAISGEIDPSIFAFRHLEHMLNQMIRTSRWYSVSRLIEFHFLQRQAAPPADISRFDNEATPELKQLESRALDAMLTVMAANSPGWMTVAVIVFAAAALKHHALKSWIKMQNRSLWYDDGRHALTPC